MLGFAFITAGCGVAHPHEDLDMFKGFFKEKSMLKLSDLSKLLGVSSSFLYKRVEKKELPHHRLGSAIRFSNDDVAAIFSQSKKEALG